MSDRLRDMLIRHEGCKLLPYIDSLGYTTIGVGRNLSTYGISQEEADLLLQHDIDVALSACARNFPWFNSLDPVRQDVLVDMCFNMGVGRLNTFRITLDAIAQGRYADAAGAMMQSTWANQVGNRAHELSRMMETGRYA